jgi:hypothetical protein
VIVDPGSQVPRAQELNLVAGIKSFRKGLAKDRSRIAAVQENRELRNAIVSLGMMTRLLMRMRYPANLIVLLGGS